MQAEEYVVYSTVLNENPICKGARHFVILDDTDNTWRRARKRLRLYPVRGLA
jgi:hypothetical protein